MNKISFIIFIGYLVWSSCALECNVNNCETCYGAEDHCVKCNSGYYVYLEQIEDYTDATKSIGCIGVEYCPTYSFSLMHIINITIDKIVIKDSDLCIHSGNMLLYIYII